MRPIARAITHRTPRQTWAGSLRLAKLACVIGLGWGASACARTTARSIDAPVAARTLAISVSGLASSEAATTVVDAIRAVDGVYDVSFDKGRVVFSVMVGPRVEASSLVDAVKRAGFSAELGDRGGDYLPGEKFPPGADVVFVVKDGADVADLSSLAVGGKITVVDLFARWCGPCREVDGHMRSVLEKRHDVAYRKLDIVDWTSPLAKHQLSGVGELPYVIVFGRDGAEIDAVAGLDFARLDRALGDADLD